VKKLIKTNAGKTIIWNLGNWLFGLAPLLLLIFVKKISNNPKTSEEIHHLLNDGLPLFVACALMGSIVVDFFNSDQLLEPAANFFCITAPCIIFGLLLLVYVLIIFNILPENYFSSSSWIYWLEIGFSIVYCSLAKFKAYKDGL
jgi:hypothetical protein